MPRGGWQASVRGGEETERAFPRLAAEGFDQAPASSCGSDQVDWLLNLTGPKGVKPLVQAEFPPR